MSAVATLGTQEIFGWVRTENRQGGEDTCGSKGEGKLQEWVIKLNMINQKGDSEGQW